MSDRYEVWRAAHGGGGGTFESRWHWRFVTDTGEVIAHSPKGYKTRATALRRIMRLIGDDRGMPVHIKDKDGHVHQVMSHLITKAGRVRTVAEAQKQFTANIMDGL